MKERKNLIAVTALLVVLVILYIALRGWNQSKEEQAAQEAEESIVYLSDAGEITEFSYTNGTDTMSFVMEDDAWYLAEDAGIPLDQSYTDTMKDAIAELSAVRELDEPDALEDYGLAEPMYEISYADENGTTTIGIGDITGEDYYATVEGSDKVYTISSTLVASLSFDLADYVVVDSVPTIGSGNLISVEVVKDGESVIYTEDADKDELGGGFGALSFDTCVDYNADEDEKASYGLDEESRMTITAIYTDNTTEEEMTFIVYAGGLDETGEYQYVMVDGSNMVYQVTAAVVENMTTGQYRRTL